MGGLAAWAREDNDARAIAIPSRPPTCLRKVLRLDSPNNDPGMESEFFAMSFHLKSSNRERSNDANEMESSRKFLSGIEYGQNTDAWHEMSHCILREAVAREHAKSDRFTPQ